MKITSGEITLLDMLEIVKKDNRKTVLLKAAYDILKKCNESGIALNVLEETAHYDGADCDGYCLMNDIGEELGLEIERG